MANAPTAPAVAHRPSPIDHAEQGGGVGTTDDSDFIKFAHDLIVNVKIYRLHVRGVDDDPTPRAMATWWAVDPDE